MNTYLVLTVISDDKPGVVEALSQVIAQHGGNWLESRMSHLAGKFAGILQVSIMQEQVPNLKQALEQLASRGIQVMAEEALEKTAQTAQRRFRFSLVGADRPGIVKEISQAFSSQQINIDELDTNCSSIPYSGEPLFTAHGLLSVPTDVDLDKLTDQLEEIGDHLGVDIELESFDSEESSAA